MLTLDPDFAKRLGRHEIEVDLPDPDTLVLRHVPADRRRFSKSRTNLMLIRPREDLPFLVCVDEDLVYTGGDALIVKAFAAAQVQKGWRILNLADAAPADVHRTLDYALGVLGFQPAEEGVPIAGPAGTLLKTFGEDLTAGLRRNTLEPTVGRTDEILRILASLLSWQARLAVIVGLSGVGKTNLIRGVASGIAHRRPGMRLVSVDLGEVMAGIPFEHGREQMLASLLGEMRDAGDAIAAFEHLELAVAGCSGGPLLLSRALDQGARIVGTLHPSSLADVAVGPLARRLDVVHLAEPAPEAALEVLRALRDRIAAHHGVEADDAVVQEAVKRAAEIPGHFPAKVIRLLDAAAAHAALAGECSIGLYHLYIAAAHCAEGCAEKG